MINDVVWGSKVYQVQTASERFISLKDRGTWGLVKTSINFQEAPIVNHFVASRPASYMPAGPLIFCLSMLFVMFGGSACHALADTQRPADVISRTLPQIVAGIVTRTAELNYITEQDS